MTSAPPISPNIPTFPCSLSSSSKSIPPTFFHSAFALSLARFTIRSILSASLIFSSCNASTLPHSAWILVNACASLAERWAVGREEPGGMGRAKVGVVDPEEEGGLRACLVKPQ